MVPKRTSPLDSLNVTACNLQATEIGTAVYPGLQRIAQASYALESHRTRPATRVAASHSHFPAARLKQAGTLQEPCSTTLGHVVQHRLDRRLVSCLTHAGIK